MTPQAYPEKSSTKIFTKGKKSVVFLFSVMFLFSISMVVAAPSGTDSSVIDISLIDENAVLEVTGGITPDNPLYVVDKFFDRFSITKNFKYCYLIYFL